MTKEKHPVKKPKAKPKAVTKGRNEASALLALSLLLLVLVSSYTLLAYRASWAQLTEERRAEAAELARVVAFRLGDKSFPRPSDFQKWAPGAFAVSLFDGDGRLVVTSRMDMKAPSEPGQPYSARTIAGVSKLVRKDKVYRVQVDLWSPTLTAKATTLKYMVPWVLGVDIAVVLLLLIYARRWFRPWERILSRAAEIGGDEADGDEIEWLLQAFDKTLEGLARPEDSELKALENVLGSSLESGVLVCDSQARVLALNPVGRGMLGIESEGGGAPVSELLKDYESLLATLEPAMDAGTPVQREECAVQTPTGEKTLGVTAHPLRRNDGRLRGVLVLFADLTEIKKRLASEQLSESLQQLGELTAGVAHEMRNGLATIKGYLSLVAEADQGESVDDYVDELKRETDALHGILEDFLAFARPGGRKIELVDLRSLLHRCAADPALSTPIRVQVHGDADVEFETEGDRSLLAKALSNLLLNAEQAQMSAGVDEPLLLRLEKDGERFRIEVLDQGPGPLPHLEEKLFEPFVTGREDGVGLGLSLARRIAVLHGGNLTLEHRDPGPGAEAKMTLSVVNVVT